MNGYADLLAEFENFKPKLLGAWLQAVSAALKNFPNTKIDSPPRMADFARWTVAGEPELCIEPGGFMKAYRENIGSGNEMVLESSPLYEPLKKLLENFGGKWEGTNTELLDALNIHAVFKDEAGVELRKPPSSWPANPRALRGKLNRIASNLRKAGLEVSEPQKTTHGKRTLILSLSSHKFKENTATTATPPPNCQKSGFYDGISGGGIAGTSYPADGTGKAEGVL